MPIDLAACMQRKQQTTHLCMDLSGQILTACRADHDATPGRGSLETWMAATGLAEVTTPAQRGLQVHNSLFTLAILVLCTPADSVPRLHVMRAMIGVCCPSVSLADAGACRHSATRVSLPCPQALNPFVLRCSRRC